jgi:hypothetical protein
MRKPKVRYDEGCWLNCLRSQEENKLALKEERRTSEEALMDKDYSEALDFLLDELGHAQN